MNLDQLDNSVLLIPQPDGRRTRFGIPWGLYTLKELKALLASNACEPDAIHYIADMLETGDAKNDGICAILRQNRNNPTEIREIAQSL